jgi:hypothetical protein
MPARCSHLVARGTARGEAATHPSIPAQETTARRPVPNTFLAWRQRRPRARTAQEPPPSRYGSPAARWPASRHDLEGDASQRRRIITGKRPRERREQGGRAVLTVGWQCSRGRLGEGVCAGGVHVHAGGRPPQLRLLAPGWLASSLPRCGAAAARSFPLLSRRKQRRWRGENPNGVGDLASVIRPPGAFEARPRAARGDFPLVPLAVRRAGQVAPAGAARATPRVRTVWG